MKLHKLYCNDQRFKNMTFNLNGLNVIYADVKSKEKEKKNSHSLGKTKLSDMIDFLFLKSINKKHFLLKTLDDDKQLLFADHVFYLELLLNNGSYLTVRRPVTNNTKISFALNEASVEDYIPPANWDKQNIPLGKARDYFAEHINLDFFKFKTYNYRKAIKYCFRTPPNDYHDVYQLAKFGKGKDLYWKPFMFDLLGFNGQLLIQKYENDKKREEIADYIDSLKNEYSINVGDRDELVAEKKLLEKNTREIEQEIDVFNFYEQDKSLIEKGVDEIESNISELNTEAYNLNYEIDRLNQSIKNKFAFNVDKVKKVFQEAEIFFPNNLQQDYEALIEFNNQLTTERNKLLNQTLSNKKKQLKSLNKELQQLNSKKKELLSYIKDTDSFRKFKYYQKELVKFEGQLFSLSEKLSNIDKIIAKEEQRENYLKEIEDTVKEVKRIYQKTEDNDKYSNIRDKFSSIYKAIMNENAIISWNINTNNNVDFIPPKVQSKGKKKKDTSKDEGTTYKKLLCVAFDLSILCTYNNESYFRFVYHDDVLSQQDNGIKNRLLELVNEISQRYELQYMLSVIKSDLPHDEAENIKYFDSRSVILRLHDKDETGTLFGIDF